MLKNQCKKSGFSQYNALILCLLSVLIFFTFSRFLFFLFNKSFFTVPDAQNGFLYWLQVFIGGIRFDLSALLVINIIYIGCCILPIPFRANFYYKKITKILFFYVCNIIAFATDYIDFIYFRFTEKRTTADIFRFAQTEGGFGELIPQFLRDFWYILLIFIAMATLFVWLSSKIHVSAEKQQFTFKWFLRNIIFAAFASGLCILGIRGGFQTRPIDLSTAARYAKTGNSAFVLNTPFSIIHTWNDIGIQKIHYFNNEELTKIFTPIRNYKSDEVFNKKNIVIVILEGFSAEHSMVFNANASKSYMPNLDSIAKIGTSILCYSNGLRSMEAIPAITASIPTLMRNEYLTSNYSGNEITGLPAILNHQGYKTAFFHGGANGTMNFDSFSSMAGFQHYYGMTEYNNSKDYDGCWGIFDKPFLQYSFRKIDTLGTPFFATIFTLSSHHPYTLPDEYRQTLDDPEQNSGIRESIQYADYALGNFMKEAALRDWFNNTIFVFVADHPSQSFAPYYSRLERYEIPLIFYAPNDTIPNPVTTVCQQIDIFPSLLDMLHYPETFFSLGTSLFSKHEPFAINFLNETYQFITENQVCIFDGDTILALYDRNDKQQKNNLLEKTNFQNPITI